ncbi:hypothetical protein [Bradyrhizobium sp. STM 3809]|uniref:hypothetical protein n=1 Tax=Bradyrhizobium sp. STM 3809 TaxID=551936 RepID=UPI0002406AFA|nr:hypothetical protein [Bradyrhizobium sp. STM 3809]CCD97678.1 hypothetical protein BRAS3809_1220001 [Bradyrhizobium sp. STM 3809]
MSFVAVTAEYGIVIRRHALTERGVPYQAVLAAVEADKPFGADQELLTFGPSFGREALEALTQRLTALGLVYFDDFFQFASDVPVWCELAVAFVPAKST